MIPSYDINLWAVLGSGIAAMFLGSVWYSPLLFGELWMSEMGYSKKDCDEMKKDAPKTYFLTFLSSLLMAFILAHFVRFSNANGPLAGALIGFWTWLGFIVTTFTSAVLFDKLKISIFLVHVGYYLVSYMILGAILGTFA